jgi:Lhr-like helicase
MKPALIPPEIEAWFAGRGWRVRRHQIDMLAADDAGQHALLVADTGAGKTLAGFLPQRWLRSRRRGWTGNHRPRACTHCTFRRSRRWRTTSSAT